MDANILPPSFYLKSSSLPLKTPQLKTQSFLIPRPVHFRLPRLRATSPGTSNDAESSHGSNNDDQVTTENNVSASTTDTTTTNNNNNNTARPPPSTLKIKYRPRSRSRRQGREQKEPGAGRRSTSPPPKKDWESMTLGEKTVDLYVGEKGLLFWLNKFAYASIFVVIGGWILFRFVGPSLGLYQLDTPPLSPTSLFKGSS